MNWPLIYSTLAGVAQLSGISDAGSINWAEQPGASAAFGASRLVMQISDFERVGEDVETLVDNAPSNQTVTISGQRRMTWTIRSESFSADPSVFGLGWLSNLMARLSRSTAQSALYAAGIAINDVGKIMPVTISSQDRRLSAYRLDVLLNAVENDVDTSPNAGQYIASVVLSSSSITDPAGNPTPTQVNETVGP